MKKHVSYNKLSARRQRAEDRKHRTTWGFSPVTRKKESGKIYNRKRTRYRDQEIPPTVSFLYYIILYARRESRALFDREYDEFHQHVDREDEQ